MPQASVRTIDRVIIQVGRSLGERGDCVIVELTSDQEQAIRDAFAQPHGYIYLSAAGVVSFDPPPPAPPDPFLASKVLLWRYMPASGHADAQALDAYLAGAAANDPLAITIRALRGLIRVTRGESQP